MGFTTPCFIRKIHRNFGEGWKNWGIHMVSLNIMQMMIISMILLCVIMEYSFTIQKNHVIRNGHPLKKYGSVDCGTNEELFLAIAALRDDSNYMQWFIADSILSVSYDDSIGNDHYFTEPKGIMFFGMKIGIMQPLFQDVITRLP